MTVGLCRAGSSTVGRSTEYMCSVGGIDTIERSATSRQSMCSDI